MRTMVIMPDLLKDQASPTLAQAMSLRAEANATGVCPSCSAEMQMPNRAERRRAKSAGEIPKAHMWHQDGCQADIEQAARTGMN
jgi:hypothetical protein